MPFRTMNTEPNRTSILSGSTSTPALPTAARIRPQLASSPNSAVLNRLEWDTVSAILRASRSELFAKYSSPPRPILRGYRST